jgi:hypothetical protein
MEIVDLREDQVMVQEAMINHEEKVIILEMEIVVHEKDQVMGQEVLMVMIGLQEDQVLEEVVLVEEVVILEMVIVDLREDQVMVEEAMINHEEKVILKKEVALQNLLINPYLVLTQ